MRGLSLVLLSWVAVQVAASVHAQDEPPRPNVLLIVADDLGFADLGCYGGDIRTPNLDILAEDGLRFTQFYTAGEDESSRASLLTGYYRDQLGQAKPSWAKTLPQLLKSAGYRSYHSGKWQLDRWFNEPIAGAGFDRSYHLVDTEQHHWPNEHYLDGDRLDAVDRSADYNATKASTDYMLRFLEEHRDHHRDQPFFAYLAYTAPHHPLQADPDDIADYADQYADGWDARRARIFVKQRQLGLIDTNLAPLDPKALAPGGTASQRRQLGPGEVPYALRWLELNDEQQRFQAEKMRIYAAMIDRMDRELGRVIAQLRRMRAYENTLIIFTSDNGANAEIFIGAAGHDPAAAPGSGDAYLSLGPGWASASNTPFRSHKFSAYEGGVAVPMIVHWRRAIEDEGAFKSEVAHLIDLAPTILQLAGVEPDALDDAAPALPGMDLTPILTDNVRSQSRELFFNHAGSRALRLGDWKIVASEDERAWSLYDMRSDRAEGKGVGRGNPEKLLELAMRWERLSKDFKADAER